MTPLTIPVLPCTSLADTLAFYRALGFDVTHEQTRPNVYAATTFAGLHLHFAGLDDAQPRGATGTCLAIVREVEALHREFSERLRRVYGKVPLAGAPRLTRFKKGQSRFTLVDVTGNSLIFIRAGATDDYDEADAPEPRSSLGRALQAAARLRDFRNDDDMASRVLDAALRKNPNAPRVDRARALAARAELALVTGDVARAAELKAALTALALTPEERDGAARELDALAALEQRDR